MFHTSSAALVIISTSTDVPRQQILCNKPNCLCWIFQGSIHYAVEMGLCWGCLLRAANIPIKSLPHECPGDQCAECPLFRFLALDLFINNYLILSGKTTHGCLDKFYVKHGGDRQLANLNTQLLASLVYVQEKIRGKSSVSKSWVGI